MNDIWDSVLLLSGRFEMEKVAKVASHALARARALNDVLRISLCVRHRMADDADDGSSLCPQPSCTYHERPTSDSKRPQGMYNGPFVRKRRNGVTGQALLHMSGGGNIRP